MESKYGKIRKSRRQSRKPKVFDFQDYETFRVPRCLKKKLKPEVEDKETETAQFKEMLARKITDTLTPIVMNKLDILDLHEDKNRRRCQALLSRFKDSVSTYQQGLVFSSNGKFFVTSSDRTKTYTIKMIPLADKMYFSCNCNESILSEDKKCLVKEERLSCKHIFATIIFSMNSAMESFFQKSSIKSIEDIQNVVDMFEELDVEEVKDVTMNTEKSKNLHVDYFSLLCANIQKTK